MSNPEVGEAFVKLRVDPGDFEGEITDAVEKGAKEAQDILDEQIRQQAQAITDLQLQAQAAAFKSVTARLQGDEPLAKAQEFASGLLNLQANIAQAQFAAEQTIRQAAEAMGAEKEALLAAAEGYKETARIAQETLERSQKAGRIVDPKVPGGSVLEKLEAFGAASGSRGGLALLLSSGARLGAVGLAATAAFQAFNQLQSAIRVSGDNAFTLEGRLRNVTASLLTLNVVGAVKALTDQRPVEIVGDLAAKLEEAKQKADPFVLTQEKLIAAYNESPEALGRYVVGLEILGKVSDGTAQKLFDIAKSNAAIERSARVAEQAMSDVAEAIQRAGSEAAAFGERGNEFGRGVGAIQREAELERLSGGTFQAGTGGTEVGNEVRASITARIADDRERLAKELENARIIQAQKRAIFENVRGTNEAAAAYKQLVAATTSVAQLQRQVKEAAELAAQQSAANAQSIRESVTSRIRDDGTRLGQQLEDARLAERQARAAFEAARGTDRAAEAYRRVVEATTTVAQLQNQIADQAEAQAEAAAQAAQQTTELSLQNAIARAALTKRKDDDKEAFDAAIAYYKDLAKNASTSLEREQATAKLLELRASARGRLTEDTEGLQQQRLQNAVSAASLTGRLSDDRKAAEALVRFWKSQVQDAEGLAKARAEGSLIDARARLAAVDRSATDLRELRLRNRQAAAQLTSGLADDKAAADALIRFWKEQVKQAEGVDKERARSSLIAAQLARKSLDRPQTETGGPSTIDFLGISRQIFQDFASNLFPTGSFDSVRGLFSLPGIQAAAGGPEEEQVNELRRIRQILEQQEQGFGEVTVNVDQNFQVPDPSGFAQARFAKFAMEEAFNG